MVNLAPIHWVVFKWIMKYLKKTNHSDILHCGYDYLTPITHLFQGWSDVDWVGDLETKKFTFDYFF
jgi:hypothetical protein